MSNLSQVQQAELTLSVLSGPDKGAVYKLTASRITLGRATENDIVIQDPRCSRHQAVIELAPSGMYISDTSDHKGITVDGTVTKKTLLKNGSNIILGTTILRFDVRSATTPIVSEPKVPGVTLTPMAPKGARKQNFYIMVGAIALIFIWLLTSQTVLKKKSVDIRTETQIDEDIKNTAERTKAIEKALENRGVETPEYKQMQGLFQQGFRDYREGNYGRALSAFDSVLALKPDHELARRYRDLARRRLDELVQLTMLEAKRYMEQSKYQLARSAYQQVMILINDPRNKLYQEAQGNFKECELLLKGAF